MTLNEYQEKAMTTCTESSMNFAYALTGLNAEVGEINDKVAKAIRKEEAVIASNELMVRCSESLEARKLTAGILAELGDVLWFVALLCKASGVDNGRGCPDESRQTRRPRQTQCHHWGGGQ